jgi:hypothetical protein
MHRRIVASSSRRRAPGAVTMALARCSKEALTNALPVVPAKVQPRFPAAITGAGEYRQLAEMYTFQAEIRLRCTSDIKVRRGTLQDQVALANLSRNELRNHFGARHKDNRVVIFRFSQTIDATRLSRTERLGHKGAAHRAVNPAVRRAGTRLPPDL